MQWCLTNYNFSHFDFIRNIFRYMRPPPLKILLLMSPVVIEGNNLHNLCMAPAPAPAPCIAASLYRCIAF